MKKRNTIASSYHSKIKSTKDKGALSFSGFGHGVKYHIFMFR